MSFLISTSSAVTLDDLGGKALASGLTNYNLELEFKIEEIRYSASLAEAIFNGDVYNVSDEQGRAITAQGTLAATQELLRKSFHVLNSDDLPEGTTNQYFTETRARGAVGVALGDQYLSYNPTTGEFSMNNLAITDVTVDTTATTIEDYVATNYTGTEHQEGDTIVLTNATGGTKIYMHNGGSAGTAADFTLIQQPNVDQATVRSWFSATAPMQYNNLTGAFSMTQANTTTDGWVSSTDWNTFNDKQNALNPNGAINISLDNISVKVDNASIVIDGTNDWIEVNADGIDQTHIDWGTIGDQVNASQIPLIDAGGNFTTDFVENALTELADRWDSIDNLGDVDTTTVTPSVGDILEWNGSNWVPAGIRQAFTVAAASNANLNTNRFLDRQDGLATNLGPYVMPYNAQIKGISLSTDGAETWTAIVYINGSPSTAQLASGGADSAYTYALSTAVSAGDKISIYCSGSSIRKPAVTVWVEGV